MANDSGVPDPFLVASDPANGVQTNGDDARYSLAGLTMGTPGAAWVSTGVYPSAFDSAGIQDLRVQAQSSPNMSVLILYGNYVVSRSGHGPYWGGFTASQTVSIASNSSGNPRYDLVIIRNRDSGVTGDGTVTKSAFPFVIQGTPAASPTVPTASMTDGDVPLAYVLVGSGVASILGSKITDQRLYCSARGGIYPAPSYDTRLPGYPGQYRDNMTTHALERSDGTQWVPIATPSTWTQFTPTLFATGGGVNVNLGTGGVYVGRYQVTGKRLDFTYYWHYGTSGIFGSHGPIVSYLPAGIVSAGYNQWVTAHLWVNTSALVADFNGQALIGASSNVVRPWFEINTDDNRSAGYQIASSDGTAGTGVPLIPGSYPQGGDLTISGSIEIA